jgi:hypothetical protein
LWLAATDEMHDLNPILIAQHGATPLTTAHNFAIELDGYSPCWQIELGD